jgi:nitrite reductase/ring-hydroxylating ferredoxin subunit
MTKHVVANAADLPPGGRKRVEIGGRPIAVFNIAGELFAILDRCPHQGGSLSAGYLTGRLTSPMPGDYAYDAAREIIRCPWHAWEFDLRTGRSHCDPARVRVRAFPVERRSGETLLAEEAPATEIFPVSREGEYVVVEL